MNYNISSLIEISVLAALHAGKRILEIYHQDDFGISLKSDNSPLTLADKVAHKSILSELSKTNIPILSEEGAAISYEERKNWDLFWLVDPLDGTKEFIKKNGEFTVNIALIKDNIPIAGVIYIPVINKLYFADVRIAALKIDNKQFISQLITAKNIKWENLINNSQKLPFHHERKYTVVGSRSHLSDETKAYIHELEKKHGEISIISKGSSLKFCMLAEGAADIYPRFGPTMEWDTGAGHAIVSAMGGSVNKIDGAPLIYNKENLLNPFFIVKK